jgi:hypothetical protein
MRYLVDYPVDPYFPYIALAPWPQDPLRHQIDWVDSVNLLESWLSLHIGQHYSAWVYATVDCQLYYQACVAFGIEKHKSLFLLRFGR